MHAVHSTLIQWKRDRLDRLKFMEQGIIVLDICQSINHKFFGCVACFYLAHPNQHANAAVLHLCSHLLPDQIVYLNYH